MRKVANRLGVCTLLLAAFAGFNLRSAFAAGIAFVQENSATPQSPQTTVSVTYTKAQAAGDLNVVVVGWNDSTAQVQSVTDSVGNTYALAGVPTVQSGTATQAIYYAKNIVSAAANANIVKVTFSVAAIYPDIRIAEYSGLDPATPVDVEVGAQGNSATSSSGAITTTNANDLLIGANLVQTGTTGAGSGYTKRVITSPDGDILEDRTVTATGSYSATAPISSGAWVMQMVAFRAAGSSGGTTPNITSLSPTSGPVGTSVTISGANFGATQGTSTITFNGTAAIPTSWSATSIVAPVPSGATTGNVVVTVGGVASNGVAFTVTVPTPNITSLSPTSGPVGTSVTISGANFGATQGTSTITFNGTAAIPTSWSATSIVAPVPSGATTGNVVVTVGGVASNGVAFTVTVPTPNITSLSPTSGPVGTSVTISGANFGATQGTSTITFNGTAAIPTSWSATSIVAPVPSGATTGNVVVTVSGVGSNGVTFTVGSSAPTITSLSPTSGPVGTSVTISGTNFGATQGTSTVTFNGTAATPTSWSATSIVAPVPSGATTGNVVVTVGAVASNVVSFTVTTVSTIGFVQVNSATPQTPQTTVSVTYTKAQAANDLNVVVVGWNDSTAQVQTVTDSMGNVYALAVGPTAQSGVATQAIYYAKNIVSAAAGANIVTVMFNTAAAYPDIRIAEYSGLDPFTPLDVTVGAQGNSAASSSGAITTTNANDLLIGANLVQTGTTGAGSGYTKRVITSPDGDILEDRTVTATGSYSATAPISSGAWIMQMVAFRAAGSAPPPPISVSVSPTTASTPTEYGTQIFTATIQNDLQNNGVTWALSGAGCSGSACGTLSNVTTTSATYTAPANVPSPATVTITATSVTDSTKSAQALITVTQGTLFISISPKRAALTLSQSQQFTATVYNDPQNGGVTWSVDGNSGGNAESGTVSSTGLFVSGTQPGVHTITATSNSNATISASVTAAVTDLAGVFTYHNDTARTGQNLQEYALTPTTVNPSTFGSLFSCSVDGYMYATPLYVANLNIAGQTHNVVFVATENDSVYAFDADSPSCIQLWHISFLSSGVTTVPTTAKGNISDLPSEIGVTSTPVIDPTTDTIYVIANTKETVGSGCSTSKPCYYFRLHALDVTTGSEKFGGPVVVSAPNFVPLQQLQRPALALSNGSIYVGFGSNDDVGTGFGWLMAYNATTLAQQWYWQSISSTSNLWGSVWGAGNGPAVDASGNVYVETGNGYFDGTSNFSDSVIKFSPSGTLLDYFTPFDQGVMQANDIDLGSSGPMILPDSVGSSAHPHLMIGTGKVGVVYLLDQTNLGKYNTAANQDVGETDVNFNTTDDNGGFFGQPAYWNGNLYTVVVGDSLRQYPIGNGAISTVSSSNSSNAFTFRGATPAVSADGTTNGIVWVADITAYQSDGAVILDAYDATNLSTLLYTSPASGTGAAVPAAKFTVPTVANGKVYVGGQTGFTVFGLLPN